MAWIESHQAIGNHPKTILLAEILKIKLPTAVGHLHYLWWWALDYAQDGQIGKFGAKVVAHACHWTGKPEVFVDGLAAAGFLERTPDALAIHDWDEYAGSLLERRTRDRDRKRMSRGQPEDVRTTSNGTSAGHPPDSDRTSGLAREGARNRTNRTNQPDQPTGLVRSGPSARGPDVAAPRPTPAEQEDSPERLPNGAQQCPLCPQIFTGTYADHLATASTHKIRDKPEDFGRPSSSRGPAAVVTEAEIAAELEAMPRPPPVELPPELLAEHEKRLARERARKRSTDSELADPRPAST